jgi:ankyrin repeat protein
MQMANCTSQNAHEFIAQVHPFMNTPLTHTQQTILMLAASISSLNLVKAILQYQPNPHQKDSIGRTALHYAASIGSI